MSPKKATRSPPERLVQRLWQARGTGCWRTSSGEVVQVAFPGRHPGGAGPDFRDARLALGSDPQRPGDVEVHVRSSAWRAHGHHLDPRYNRVGLQVVLWDDAARPCLSLDGAKVPLVVLGEAIGQGPLGRAAPPEPCQGAGGRRGWAAVASALEAASLERLRERARELEAAMAQRGPDQALYEGIMEALGYSQNRAPFVKLAQGLPWSHLMAGRWAGPVAEAEVTADLYTRLIQAAGLAPGEADGPPSVVSAGEWTTAGVRPANHPRRRLGAAAALRARYRGRGLVAGLLPYIDKGPSGLEGALMVPAPDRGPALLGRARVTEIAVNVVLPFFYSWGQRHSHPEVTARILATYSGYPASGDDQVTRHLTSQLWGRPVHLARACHQQGCHHVFRHHCQPRRCPACPLGLL